MHRGILYPYFCSVCACMNKKYAFFSVGLLLLATPGFALAQTDVSAQIAALQAQVAQFQALLTQLQSPAPSTATGSNLPTNLSAGDSDAAFNGEVTELQQFLGVSVTGTFDAATEQ